MIRLQQKSAVQQPNVQKRTWLSKRTKEQVMGLLFVGPSLIGVSIFLLIPFLDVLRRSVMSAMSGEFVGVGNYTKIFQNEAFQLAGWNTIRFVLVCIPFLLLFSLGLALLIYRLKTHGTLFKMTFLLPMAIPVASVVLLWQVLFHQNGVLSQLVISLGGTGTDWMNSDYAFWILVASYIWRNIGYDMVLWLAGLSTLSEAVFEAAKVDGANRWQMLRWITLPQLSPTIFMIVVLSLLNTFKVFREAYLIAGDYPHDSMYMLQHLFNNWFLSLDIDKLSAAATVTAMVIFVFILGVQKAWGGEMDD